MRPKPLRLGKLPGWLVSYMPLARGFPRLLRAASKASRGQDSRSSSQSKRVGTLRGPEISSKSSVKIDKSYRAKCDASSSPRRFRSRRRASPSPGPTRRTRCTPARMGLGRSSTSTPIRRLRRHQSRRGVAPRKHRDPERARARARAAAARPHHSKWSPRDVAAAIADEVGRNEQKA